jgi:hypothetical protein
VNARGDLWLADRHADATRSGAAEAQEDPAVEGNNDKEDAEWDELDESAPVRSDERSKE